MKNLLFVFIGLIIFSFGIILYRIDSAIPNIDYAGVSSVSKPVNNTGVYPNVLGSVNPDITQSNLSKTLCNPLWSTKTIRPSTSITGRIKQQKMKELGYTDPTLYELDHLISLELGGAPADPNNLWPEKWNNIVNGQDLGAHTKDKVENYLHKQVCSNKITLKEAQREISTDWYGVYKKMK